MKYAYSFADVAVLMNGFPLTGFGEGDDVVQITTRTDRFAMVIGAKGKGVPVKSEDRSAEIVLGILQGHEDNAVIGGFLAKDDRSGIFTGVELQIVILKSGERVGGRGVITKPADRNMGAGLNRYDWPIIIEECEFLEGTLPEAVSPSI